MSAEVSYTKRTASELSRCFNGLSVSRNNYKTNGSTANGSAGSSHSTNNEEDDELDAITKSFQEQNLTEQSNGKLNGLSKEICKEEKVLKNGASLNHKQNGRTIIPLYESELFLKIQNKANLMNVEKTVETKGTEESGETENDGETEDTEETQDSEDAEDTEDFEDAEETEETENAEEIIETEDVEDTENSDDTEDSDYNGAMITRSSTIINLFEQCSGTPSKRSTPVAPPKTCKARRKNFLLNIQKPTTEFELLHDEEFLLYFFSFFTPKERCLLAQVCSTWKDILYSEPNFWIGLMPIIYTNELRRLPVKIVPDPPDPWLIGPYIRKRIENFRNQESADSTSSEESVQSDLSLDERYNFHPNRVRAELYASIEKKGFNSVCIYAPNDDDILDFVTRISPSVLRSLQIAAIHCGTITDKGLDIFLASVSQSLKGLELIGCNEISDSGLWTSLVPHLEHLIIRDCINISDETIAAISQLLPALRDLCLQTYHMSDVSTSFFSPVTMRKNLRTLRLENCWELTDQGVTNIAHSLPHLEGLTLLGCSKITDEAIEVLSERVRRLRFLDLSWCARITDGALQYIACDLSIQLRALNLDRCPGITDEGVGYISQMRNLNYLSLRGCAQLSDASLSSICNLKRLQLLYLAGNTQFTFNGLLHLTHMRNLELVDLSNCPAVTYEFIQYMNARKPNCEVMNTKGYVHCRSLNQP